MKRSPMQHVLMKRLHFRRDVAQSVENAVHRFVPRPNRITQHVASRKGTPKALRIQQSETGLVRQVRDKPK